MANRDRKLERIRRAQARHVPTITVVGGAGPITPAIADAIMAIIARGRTVAKG